MKTISWLITRRTSINKVNLAKIVLNVWFFYFVSWFYFNCSLIIAISIVQQWFNCLSTFKVFSLRSFWSTIDVKKNESGKDWKSFKSLNCMGLSSFHFFIMHDSNNGWRNHMKQNKYTYVTSKNKKAKNVIICFCQIHIVYFLQLSKNK